jgi:histidine triad (HIT) family protein
MERYSTEENPTVFGKIVRGEIPADVVYEDDQIMAFRDIAPQAPVHVVVIPKAHMACLRCAGADDAALLGHMMAKIPHIAKDLGLEAGGYRVISNAGPDAGQEVPHLHFHILGGKSLGKLVAGA